MPEPEGRPPERAPDPAPDRCPTCGGELERLEDEPERFCPRCGVFVGFPEPFSTEPPEAKPETPASPPGPDDFLASFAAFSEEADRENVEDRADAPPAAPHLEAESEPRPAPETPPQVAPTPAEGLPVLPAPAKEIKALPPAEAPPPPPESEAAPTVPPAGPPGVPAEVPSSEEPKSGEVSEPRPPLGRRAEAAMTGAESQPAEVEAEEERRTEPAPEPEAPEETEIFECPKCGAQVAPDAHQCPSCKTLFGKAVPEAPAPPPQMAGARAGVTVSAAASKPASSRRPGAKPKPSRLDRAVFYVGAAQVALGGSGLVLGSFLHDFFRVPVIGSAYNAFGPVNLTALLIGAVLLAAGAGTMAAGARHGRRRGAHPRGA